MSELIKMTAIAAGTVVSVHSDIVHVDPDGVPEAQRVRVTEEVALKLEARSLAKRGWSGAGAKAAVAADEDAAGEEPTVEAKRVADTAKVDAETDTASGLDSRQTTNYPVEQNVHGGAEGIGDGLSDDDEDAPPPPPPPARPAAARVPAPSRAAAKPAAGKAAAPAPRKPAAAKPTAAEKKAAAAATPTPVETTTGDGAKDH